MNSKFFIMGAPNAGKSTYLAALWHSINQKENSTVLTLKRMVGDSQYLWCLEQKWLEVEPLERTVIGQEKTELIVFLTNGEDDLELEFPDLSGETFQNMYEDRDMTFEIHDKISRADAVLYFINIENIHVPESIAEMPEDLRTDDGKVIERKPSEHDPTQVQIIDLLQTISEIVHYKKIKLGIILSAWDVLPNFDKINPREYLKERMNMLWQYIEANTNIFNTIVWGVSALGGKIEEIEKLLDIDEPINRIIVKNEHGVISHDITSIIAEMSGETNDR